MNRRDGILFLAIVLCTGASARASDSLQVAPPAGILVLHTIPAGADAVLDSMVLGPTPLDTVRVTPGTHRLRIFAPSRNSWDPAVITDSMIVAAGDTIRRTYTVDRTVRVWSIPSGAEVVMGDSVAGTTPLALLLPARFSPPLAVRLAGYRPTEVRGDTLGSFASVVRLRPVDGGTGEPPWDLNGSFLRERRRETLLAGSAGLMVVSGVLAAAWKSKANDDYDAYLASGDPALLDATHRLDTRAGIALAVTQVSFLLLSYLLLSD